MSGPRSLERFLSEAYAAPYRRAVGRARRDADDLLMLLVFSEALGIPSPMGWASLELLPIVHDRFHEWHLRMGFPRSPLDDFRCC